MNRSIKDSFGLIVSSAIVVAMVLCLAVTPARAQEKNRPDRITKAAQRSENAAQVLDMLMASNQVAIAQYLLDNAQAVAVFPQTIRTSVLLNVLIHGQGVVSRRVPGGWGAPAFFTFKGADINFKFGKESMNIIIFFMNDEAVSWLLKEKIGFNGKKKAVTSPIGKGELKPDINVIIYTATAEGFGSVEHLGIGIGADNDLNKIIYGLKAREILADTQNKITRNAPEGIYQFPQSLARYSTRR